VAVELTPGASGKVFDAARSHGVTRFGMALSGGPALVDFDGEKDATLIVDGASGPLKLRASRGAQARIVPTPKGPRVEVTLGEVEIGAAERTARVAAGSVAAVSKGGFDVSERPRPPLVLPLDKKVSVFGPTPPEVGLVLPGGPCQVVVADNAAYERPVLQGEAKDLLAVAPPVGAELFWRATCGSGEAQEGHARFSSDSADGEGGAREEVVSETGLKATLYYQGALPSLTFTFAAQDEAARYRLKIYRAGELSKPLVQRDVGDTRCTVESGALGEGNFVWYAAALDGQGNEHGGGKMNKMEILFNNRLTSLSIERPARREAASSAAKAQGVAPLRSKLFVNGKPIATDANGRFSTGVGNVEWVVFHLVFADGAEGFWLRHLRRER
jgi:hypothetical protein